MTKITVNKKKPRALHRRLDPAVSRMVIDELGGAREVSQICSRSLTAVSDWKREGIPSAWVFYLREKFKNMPVMNLREVSSFSPR